MNKNKTSNPDMKFYRYESRSTSSVDEFGDVVARLSPDPHIYLNTYNIYKETPKGYWIGYGHPDGLQSDKRWVSKTARKRYAYPTKKEALESLIIRRKKQVKILEWQRWTAEIALKKAEKLKENLVD